jgi:NodT family efflux transporter outer membrane factor (OMF) lipoprotein
VCVRSDSDTGRTFGFGSLLLAALVSGCAVGPAYVRPALPVPAAYKEAPVGADVLEPAHPIDAVPRRAWWEDFADPRLNDLEARLLRSNPTLAQADARVREARALIAGNRAGYFPTVGVSTSVDRSRIGAVRDGSVSSTTGQATTAPAATGPSTQYDLAGSVSWEPDFWGRVRRTVEASVASAQAATGDLENARLSLTANLALDYFQARSLDAELALLSQTIEAYQRSFTLTQNQYNAGLVARADVAQAEALLEAARAQLVDTGLQRAQMEHAVAVLAGEAPAVFTLPALPLDGVPPAVPAELPSRLLERRADIAAAERRVAAANAQVGVATSAFFPTVSLTGSAGFSASAVAQWLTWPSRIWSLGPALAATVFDGGARRAARTGAVAAYDEQVGAYKEVVLTAFQEVEDNLAAQRLLADESTRQQAAVAAARRALDVSLNQYRAGLVSFLPVATAQSTLLTDERTLTALTARRFAAAVQLIEALGGGWDARRDLPTAADLSRTSNVRRPDAAR